MKLTLQKAYERATKGPLEVRHGDICPCDSNGGRRLATMYGIVAEAQVNAALLAHAFNVLPEVLAVVEQLVNGWYGANGASINIEAEVFKKARAALAKASTVEVAE